MIHEPACDYTDQELEAECRMIGSLMAEPALWGDAKYRVAIPPTAFCVGFHMAAYYAILGFISAGCAPDPVSVWGVVKSHPCANDFGLAHLCDLMLEASRPETFADDQFAVLMRSSARVMNVVDLALERMARGKVH